MKRFLTRAAVPLMVLTALSGQAQGGTISTLPSWNGIDYQLPFGEGYTETFGQTFTVVGTETQLNSFKFYLQDFVNPDYVDFAFYLAAWDGSKATGSLLYSSSMLSTTNNHGLNGYESFTVNTGGVQLTAGQQYVAFISASNFFDGSPGYARLGTVYTNSYSGGRLVRMNNNSNFGSLFTNNWFDTGSGHDLAFEASFSEPTALPTPGTLALFGIGFVSMLVNLRRRKKLEAAL
jgi:hypothetical protein